MMLNKRVLITAGPTYEPIDPVRFIGNHSTGKMGYNIAEIFAELGCRVELVSGRSCLKIKHSNINLTKVTTAHEMYEASVAIFPNVDIGVLAAAVADFTPINVAKEKMKKADLYQDNESDFVIRLKKTKDILLRLGKIKKEKQILVGFSLETNNELENAQKKLEEKNLDLIVLNSLRDKDAGFGYDTNKITIIDRNKEITEFTLKHKKEVALDIVNKINDFICF